MIKTIEKIYFVSKEEIEDFRNQIINLLKSNNFDTKNHLIKQIISDFINIKQKQNKNRIINKIQKISKKIIINS